MTTKAERVIALIAGPSGAGKSFFIANLTRALIFDTDIGGGLSYAEARIARNGSRRIEVGSYTDILEELKRNRSQLANYSTVAIDHLTSLQQESVLRHNPALADDWGRSGNKANQEWRKIREIIRHGDFNLFCTAHTKSRYENDKPVGDTTDASKNIEADMSVVLYLKKSGPPPTAVVQKWRRDPDDPRGKVPASFPLTLDKFLAIHGHPLDAEREEIPLATRDQVDELSHLLTVVKLDDGLAEKWLAKAKADSWADLTYEQIQKCINHVRNLIPTTTKKETNGQPQ